jgi:glutathione S-transferase
MTLKIYGVTRSRATRPIWMAKELGIPYEQVPVIQHYRLPDSSAANAPFNTGSPAFRAVNPNGLVPTIDDDGFVLNESLAITIYLARKHGGPLAPKDAKEEGLTTMWTLWAATEVEAPALRSMQNSAAVKTRDEAVFAAAVTTLQPKLAVLDKALSDGGGYLVGGRFTVADLNVAEVVRYAQGAPELFDTAPNVKAWLSACQSRPAFKQMWAERDAEPA